MPAERIAMRQVRDVLRLNAAGVSGNEIARRVGVAPPPRHSSKTHRPQDASTTSCWNSERHHLGTASEIISE